MRVHSPKHMVLRASLLATTALLALTFSSTAAAQHDWAAKDVKGRSVKTADYRGKVLVVFVSSADTRDQMKPVIPKLVTRYGKHPKVAQLTIVDLREAPFAWKAAEKVNDEVTDRIKGTHDRTVKRMNAALVKDGQKPIAGLDKKLHIVLDWKGKLVKKYNKVHNTSKFINIIVIDPAGKQVGAWKLQDFETAMKKVEELAK